MDHEFLPFSRPSISESDIAAVVDVLRSGWITTGLKTAEFEEEFCRYTGSSSAVAVSSATAGMHLLLKVLDIGPGDEVITPSMTWVSTVNLIILTGATPVFVDIDRDTLMVTPAAVEERITGRTKLIIPVHYAGAAAPMKELKELADKKGIFMIEDAAHSLGTHYDHKHIGGQGTAVFSFHPIKNITSAEGGIICSEDQGLVDRVRRLKFHGLGIDAYDRKVQGRAPQAEVLEPGFKYNLTDLSAALGLSQLSRLDDFNRQRTRLAMKYRQCFSEIEEIIPLKDPPDTVRHSWHLFIVRLTLEKVSFSRNEFMERLREKNIGTGLHFKAVHLHKYYREVLGLRRGMLPNTEWNSDRIVSLPLFPDMTEEDVVFVVDAIRGMVRN